LDDTLKQAYIPDGPTKAKLHTVIESLPQGIERPSLDNLQLYRAGSSAENPYGFSGQLALREQITMTPEISELLKTGGSRLSTGDIDAAASKGGMTTMLQDGVLKVIAGQTTLEEIY